MVIYTLYKNLALCMVRTDPGLVPESNINCKKKKGNPRFPAPEVALAPT